MLRTSRSRLSFDDGPQPRCHTVSRPGLADDELFDFIRDELSSAVVGDVMDQLGLFRQFLPAEIRPLAAAMRVAGRAMPVLVEDLADGSDSDRPFGLMLEALDNLRPNEVYLCGGGSPTYALWGELMSTRARTLGATGAVVDGYYRDSEGILGMGFPTFGYGAYAQDQAPRGQVVDYRSAIRIGQVVVEPGDIVVGDRDGVCVVPRRCEEDVLTLATDKASGENLVRREIQRGMSSQDAFAKYGIM